jgi:hypothetical protein
MTRAREGRSRWKQRLVWSVLTLGSPTVGSPAKGMSARGERGGERPLEAHDEDASLECVTCGLRGAGRGRKLLLGESERLVEERRRGRSGNGVFEPSGRGESRSGPGVQALGTSHSRRVRVWSTSAAAGRVVRLWPSVG